MKSIGQIAFEEFSSPEVRRERSANDWEHADRERWERTAKAVAIAAEGAERRTTSCEDAPVQPRGTVGPWRCVGEQPIPYPNAFARERGP